jgi:CheY-like chemotaxis protein
VNPEPLILLAEDDPDDVFLIKRALEKACVVNRVETVSTGSATIAYLEASEPFSDRSTFPLPALLLLDLRMPGLDGFDVLRHIQKRPHLHGLRIVVITSSVDVRDMNEAYRLGAAGFIIKPGDFLRLVEFSEALAGSWLWLDTDPLAPSLPAAHQL